MCTKTEYPTYRQAARELHRIRRRAKAECPKRVYFCQHCKQFHLTSKLRYPYGNP